MINLKVPTVVAAAATLAGCMVGPNYQPPKPDMPAGFASSSTPAPTSATATAQPGATLRRWWELFQDPELTSLVDRAIEGNPDLAVALLRLQEARTEEAVVMGSALPELGVSGAAGRGSGTDLTRGMLAPPLSAADNRSGRQITQVIGFDAGWELDVFGKYRREYQAAAADSQAAAAARDEVLVATVADVAQAYFDLRGTEMREAVLQQDIETALETVKLVQTRYDHGLVNELDVALSQRELATLRAEVAPFTAQIDAARDTIAVLLGTYPEAIEKELATPGVIPPLPAPIGAGLPVDLLRRRPDIVEAEREIAGASARIGVATADLFPSVVLTGAVGWQGLGGSTGAGSPSISSGGVSGAWPLLDFGTLDALVDVADLRSREFLVQYKATVLAAVRDVDTALADYAAQQDRLANLNDALAAAHQSVTLATQRYNRGLTDFLNVLDAQEQEYALEDQFAASDQQAADALAALYKGLGGGWEDYQSVPPIRQPLPAVIAAFRRLLNPGVGSSDDGNTGNHY